MLFKKGLKGREAERGRLKRKGRKFDAGELALNEMNCLYNLLLFLVDGLALCKQVGVLEVGILD